MPSEAKSPKDNPIDLKKNLVSTWPNSVSRGSQGTAALKGKVWSPSRLCVCECLHQGVGFLINSVFLGFPLFPSTQVTRQLCCDLMESNVGRDHKSSFQRWGNCNEEELWSARGHTLSRRKSTFLVTKPVFLQLIEWQGQLDPYRLASLNSSLCRWGNWDSEGGLHLSRVTIN